MNFFSTIPRQPIVTRTLHSVSLKLEKKKNSLEKKIVYLIHIVDKFWRQAGEDKKIPRLWYTSASELNCFYTTRRIKSRDIIGEGSNTWNNISSRVRKLPRSSNPICGTQRGRLHRAARTRARARALSLVRLSGHGGLHVYHIVIRDRNACLRMIGRLYGNNAAVHGLYYGSRTQTSRTEDKGQIAKRGKGILKQGRGIACTSRSYSHLSWHCGGNQLIIVVSCDRSPDPVVADIIFRTRILEREIAF